MQSQIAEQNAKITEQGNVLTQLTNFLRNLFGWNVVTPTQIPITSPTQTSTPSSQIVYVTVLVTPTPTQTPNPTGITTVLTGIPTTSSPTGVATTGIPTTTAPTVTPTQPPSMTTVQPTTNQPVTAWTTLAPQTVSENTISIQNMAFNPSSITVVNGAIVRWVNNDAVVHTITFPQSSGIASSNPLSPSQSFSLKFDQPGTFTYSCAIHPSMHGTVVVNPTGITTAPTAVTTIPTVIPTIQMIPTFTQADSSTTKQVVTGSQFTVQLASNPSTGYDWSMTISPGLVIMSESYQQNINTGNMAGVGGNQIWIIKANTAGKQTLSAIYKQPWMPTTGNETSFVLYLNVA